MNLFIYSKESSIWWVIIIRQAEECREEEADGNGENKGKDS
jgi:hypothetical protein